MLLASPDGHSTGTHTLERTFIMFSLSNLHSNLLAAVCAFAASALFIGLSVGPAEIGTMAVIVA